MSGLVQAVLSPLLWASPRRDTSVGLAQHITLQVARWFFRVGGAAGTIAKSVSAYDMTISDSMYGAAKRCAPGSVAAPWLADYDFMV